MDIPHFWIFLGIPIMYLGYTSTKWVSFFNKPILWMSKFNPSRAKPPMVLSRCRISLALWSRSWRPSTLRVIPSDAGFNTWNTARALSFEEHGSFTSKKMMDFTDLTTKLFWGFEHKRHHDYSDMTQKNGHRTLKLCHIPSQARPCSIGRSSPLFSFPAGGTKTNCELETSIYCIYVELKLHPNI